MIAIRNVLAGALAGVGLAACTVGSPTYISTQDAQSDGGSLATSPSSSSTPGDDNAGGGAGGTGVATCSGDDYVKADLSKLTACGNGLGHCYDATKVALASQLVACADATTVCVPDEILEANGGKLQSCTSIIGAGGCVHAALIPEVEKQGGSALKPDVCTGGALCLPCTDPTHDNAPTPFCQPIGVHSTACATAPAAGDGGADAAPLAGCCTTKGKSNGVCISSSAVPASQRSQTKQDTCADGNACVPAAFVAGTPVKCSDGILGDGVCMDKCFNSWMGAAGDIGLLSTKGCGDTEVCVPCTFIKGTGAPGCS